MTDKMDFFNKLPAEQKRLFIEDYFDENGSLKVNRTEPDGGAPSLIETSTRFPCGYSSNDSDDDPEIKAVKTKQEYL